jgi:DNA-binding HxlR family transcriptional regulator
MALIDLIGRRWALRVIWELRGGALTFRALQTACDGVSPSVLNERLAELREVRLVAMGDDGYALTPLGAELIEALTPVQRWSVKWGKNLPG